MTRRLNRAGSKVKRGSFYKAGRGVEGAVQNGVKARRENVLCDGKVFGDKRGNGLSLVLR